VARIGSGVGEELFEEADTFPDDDEAATVAVGEGLEEDAVDDAEKGGGGSDAEGEGEDGGEGEAGGLAELAKAVAQVLQDGMHRHLAEITKYTGLRAGRFRMNGLFCHGPGG
jgi:hypothetical protein